MLFYYSIYVCVCALIIEVKWVYDVYSYTFTYREYGLSIQHIFSVACISSRTLGLVGNQRHNKASQVYAVAEMLQMDESIGTFRNGNSTELKHVTALSKPALTKPALTNTFRSRDNLLLNVKKFFKIEVGGKRVSELKY